MLTLLSMFAAPPALAGACNCGLEYYLARAEGKSDVKPQYPDDCPGHEGAEGSFECVFVDGWNPHASGDAADLQRQTFERVLAIAAKYPDADPGSLFSDAAAWRLDKSDPLYEPVHAYRPTEGRSAETWNLGEAAMAPGKLRDLAWSYCDDESEYGRIIRSMDPHLNDLGAPPSDSRAEVRKRMACKSERRWLVWAWMSLDDRIDPEGLWIYETDELAIVRNTVFARHGRPFSTPAMKGVFETGTLRLWYTRDDAYTDERLSAIDKANIALVAAYEEARKAGVDHTGAVAAARVASPEAPGTPGTPAEPVQPVAAAPSSTEESGGCGCATAALPIHGGTLLFLFALLMGRNRPPE